MSTRGVPMKPHEETWEVFTSGVLVSVQDAATKHLRANVNYKADRAALVAAAPEMARALLSLLTRDGGHLPSCPAPNRERSHCTDPKCAAIRAVLTKAGVL